MILTRQVFHWKDVIIQVWSTISRYHASHALSIQILTFLCFEKFIHSLWTWYGGTKMANNRHAVNRNLLQSYWMSDELSLYSSQMAWEKTHPNQHCERLAKIRKTTCNVAAWRQGTALLGQMDTIHNQPCSEKTMVTK